MKLKSRPDDFQVEELTAVVPQTSGPFAYYRLEKQSLGTPEAIQKLCRELRVDPRRVRYGGLKDRHAQTIQYLTIDEGPPRHFKDALIQLKYLGQVEEPYGPQSFHGNRFGITLRDLKQEELDNALKELALVKDGVIANYFDDQRFGSVSAENEYVARALIDGNEEKALKLAISSYYEHDRSQEKRAKAELRKNWGQWAQLSRSMPPSYLQKITQYLANRPDDYRGAFVHIPFFLRNMYLSAYQSYLWNNILADWLTSTYLATELIAVQQKSQKLPMPAHPTEEALKQLKALELPLPSSRMQLTEEHPAFASMNRVMSQEGLRIEDVKLKQYREPFFSKGNRDAFYTPENLQHEVGWDKLNKGNRKLRLSFTLSRGSYATLLVKRLTSCSPWQTAVQGNVT